MIWPALISAMEHGLIPDPLTRFGIRHLLAQRLQDVSKDKAAYVEMLKRSPVAVETKAANEQHYEVPPGFFELVLGPNLKYSSGYWPNEATTFAESEVEALRQTMEHADLHDGQTILELGCGWGSLTVAMAQAFPNSRIVALSNSKPQREHIEGRLGKLGLKNVEIRTRDVSKLVSITDLDTITKGPFDRVVSVEMFEHFRNYEILLKRISSWLAPDGKLFVHIFAHRDLAYLFAEKDSTDWMSKYFFTGGQMPSHDLFSFFSDDLKIEKEWVWNGQHYQKTCEAWLANQDLHRNEIMPILEATYGVDQASVWFERWRVFFIACAELFGYDQGHQWRVSHYRLSKTRSVR